uniref:Uncharacterized protein n=1 Tax=Manihot esculenta TaxID=3983 RepID=A0A2C9V251_MANES
MDQGNPMNVPAIPKDLMVVNMGPQSPPPINACAFAMSCLMNKICYKKNKRHRK